MSPAQVLEQWVKLYPTNMKEAGKLPTKSFREGLSIPEWVHNGADVLGTLAFAYKNTELEEQYIEGSTATLVLNAEVDTVVGEFLQREQYELIREDGRWLINEQEILEEKFIGEKVQIGYGIAEVVVSNRKCQDQ